MNMDEMLDRWMKKEAVYYEPSYSPWGEVQSYTLIAKGIFDVNTASHGGVLILREYAEHLLTEEARKCGFEYGRYLCFEEDCAAPVAKRELLDNGILEAPVNEFFKEGEYSEVINCSIKRWYPEYWEAYEKRMATPQEREGRMMRINQSPEKFSEYKQNTMNEIQEKISKQKSRKSREREER